MDEVADAAETTPAKIEVSGTANGSQNLNILEGEEAKEAKVRSKTKKKELVTDPSSKADAKAKEEV